MQFLVNMFNHSLDGQRSLEDIVGINVPIFFINDAILFPDLIHALKPQPNNQIPQAATAHDTAYDFFSQETSALNLVMMVMAKMIGT